VRRYLTGSDHTQTAVRSKAAYILDLESKLSSELGTKVAIEARKSGERGKIIVEFYSLDEFSRITEKMGLESVAQD
jgi:ParB family chromosome partitioning protein